MSQRAIGAGLRSGRGTCGSHARVWTSTIATIALMVVAPSIGQASVSEDEVKAAFLLNFTRYVDWPAAKFDGARAPFVICVLNDPDFAKLASGVIGDRTVSDRPITVSAREDLASTDDCHILFLPASEQAQQELVITEVSGAAVLTVSDSEGFAEMGGVANFRRAGSKLRLEINRQAAARAQLKVSARLLRIADVVG